MQAGKVDLALEDAETAYLAFTRGTRQRQAAQRASRDRGAVLHRRPGDGAGATGIRHIDELRGRRVDVGTPRQLGRPRGPRDPGQLWDRIRRASHRSSARTATRSAVSRPGRSTPACSTGRSSIRAIAAISKDVDVRVPADRAGAARRHPGAAPFPEVDDDSRPAPTRTRTATCRPSAWTSLLLCRRGSAGRAGLRPDQGAVRRGAALETAHEAASAIDPERGPTASIPLHPGAARYYREREIQLRLRL